MVLIVKEEDGYSNSSYMHIFIIIIEWCHTYFMTLKNHEYLNQYHTMTFKILNFVKFD